MPGYNPATIPQYPKIQVIEIDVDNKRFIVPVTEIPSNAEDCPELSIYFGIGRVEFVTAKK